MPHADAERVLLFCSVTRFPVERFTPFLEEVFGLAQEGGSFVQDKLVDILKRWWMEDIVDGAVITQLQACVARRQDAAELLTTATTSRDELTTDVPPGEQTVHALHKAITSERSSRATSFHDPTVAGRRDGTAKSIVMSRIPGARLSGTAGLSMHGALDPRRRPPLVEGTAGTKSQASASRDQAAGPPSPRLPSSVKRGILKSSIQIQPNHMHQAPCHANNDSKRPRTELSRPSCAPLPPVSPVSAALEAIPPMSPVSTALTAIPPLPMRW